MKPIDYVTIHNKGMMEGKFENLYDKVRQSNVSEVRKYLESLDADSSEIVNK